MIRVTFLKDPSHCGEERQVGWGSARAGRRLLLGAGEMMRIRDWGMELGKLRGLVGPPGVGGRLEVERTGK